MLDNAFRSRLRALADSVETRGAVGENLAARLREIAGCGPGDQAAFIRRRISMADWNHFQGELNFLVGSAQAYRSDDAAYAAGVAADLEKRADEARIAQRLVGELVQIGWNTKLSE